MNETSRAPRNRTITLNQPERDSYINMMKRVDSPVSIHDICDSTICQDLFSALPFLPSSSFDLIFADPPYNLTKSFDGSIFKQTDLDSYEQWLLLWLPQMKRLLKKNGSIYVCGDWRSSSAIQNVLARHFIVQNRITWEREKGRGANRNWKNNSEDIWFATMTDSYTFNLDDVKLKRRVLAPYTDREGEPKDWEDTEVGKFRVTHPSNIWNDLTVPFWSMTENTDHPTQKPEKLLARVVLASTNLGDCVFDPFLGSGTTSVVARKLSRHFVGIEISPEYCCYALKRLELAEKNNSIQGYIDGVFWERNSLSSQNTMPLKQEKYDIPKLGFFDELELIVRTKNEK